MADAQERLTKFRFVHLEAPFGTVKIPRLQEVKVCHAGECRIQVGSEYGF